MLKILNGFFRTPIFTPPYVLGKIAFGIGFATTGFFILARFV